MVTAEGLEYIYKGPVWIAVFSQRPELLDRFMIVVKLGVNLKREFRKTQECESGLDNKPQIH